jgi:sulfatase maturation enzyme AslB (radical SAM superfamily)
MTLALTGACNLKGLYCCQNVRSGVRTFRPAVEASDRRLSESRANPADFVVAGGEPLVALDLVGRTVALIEPAWCR